MLSCTTGMSAAGRAWTSTLQVPWSMPHCASTEAPGARAAARCGGPGPDLRARGTGSGRGRPGTRRSRGWSRAAPPRW
jgi:hypothetical protein